MPTKAQLEQQIAEMQQNHSAEVEGLKERLRDMGAKLPMREVRYLVTLALPEHDDDEVGISYIQDAFEGFFGIDNSNEDGEMLSVEVERY